jgi:hypothetical protein
MIIIEKNKTQYRERMFQMLGICSGDIETKISNIPVF